MRVRLTLIAAAGALALGSPAPAATPAAAAALGVNCGKIPWDYTKADIYGIGVSCAYARTVAHSWLSRAPAMTPKVLYVRGFRCVFGGTGGVVKLDCYRGGQVVRARWGD